MTGLCPGILTASEVEVYAHLLSKEKPLVKEERQPCAKATLTVQSLDDLDGQNREGPGNRVMPMEIGGKQTIRLPPGAWQLALEAGGCWAPVEKVLVGEKGVKVVRFPVWRTGIVSGTLTRNVLVASESPSELRLTFAPSLASPASQQPKGVVFCPVDSNGTFRCLAPASKLDLRLSAKGFAPEYWWGNSLAGGQETRLGTIHLAPGSSLAGWLITEQGKPPEPDAVSLVLVPPGLADSISLKDQLLKRFAQEATQPLKNGFFQFESLKAGEYTLIVSGDNFAETRLPIHLVEGRESELRDPVLLAPPLEVAFVVTPATAAGGQPWSIAIDRIHASGTYADNVVRDQVPQDGWYTARGLHPGMHLVKLLDAQGNSVSGRRVDLATEPTPIEIEVGIVEVEGRLTLGGEGIPATIWYGGQFGAQKVEVKSDENGYYRATLPREGIWRVEVTAETLAIKRRRIRAVEVEQRADGKPVQADLAMLDSRVFGSVRWADGTAPGGYTLVYPIGIGGSMSSAVKVDKDGSFEIRALEPAKIWLHARGPKDSRSDTVEIELAAGEEKEAHLVLRPSRLFKGQVIGETGPIPGAFIQVQPTHHPHLPFSRAQADGAGRFSVPVPRETLEVYATVSALERSIGVFRIPVGEEAAEIMLPSGGGTLTIEFPEELNMSKSQEMDLYFRNGMPYAVGELSNRAVSDPERWKKERTMVIPDVLPGYYEACAVPIVDYLAWLLGHRELGRCVSGNLSALGELRLTLPKGDADDDEE